MTASRRRRCSAPRALAGGTLLATLAFATPAAATTPGQPWFAPAQAQRGPDLAPPPPAPPPGVTWPSRPGVFSATPMHGPPARGDPADQLRDDFNTRALTGERMEDPTPADRLGPTVILPF